MLDILLRSLGLDQQKLQSMMSNAEKEYRDQLGKIHARFDAIERNQANIFIKLENIENGRATAGYGPSQLAAIADGSVAAEPAIPGAGELPEFDGGDSDDAHGTTG